MKLQQIFSILWLAAMVCTGKGVSADTTALDDYVAKADPNYGYVHDSSDNGLGFTSHVLTMTSQQWRKSQEVDQVIWQHELVIAVP